MPRVSDAREKLMEAARRLIWRSSYGATSVDDICAEADVRKGSFYHFFKSKAELEIAALEADWQVKKVRFNDIFAPTNPPLERLAGWFAFSAERLEQTYREEGKILGCPYCSVGAEVSTQEDGIRQKVAELNERTVKYLESALRDAHAEGTVHAPDARAKAKCLYAWFQGTLAQARIENNLELIRGMQAAAFDLLGVHAPAVTGAVAARA